MALDAARHALKAAGLEASDIDLIIVATSTPDMVFPHRLYLAEQTGSRRMPLRLTCRLCAAVLSMR